MAQNQYIEWFLRDWTRYWVNVKMDLCVCNSTLLNGPAMMDCNEHACVVRNSSIGLIQRSNSILFFSASFCYCWADFTCVCLHFLFNVKQP